MRRVILLFVVYIYTTSVFCQNNSEGGSHPFVLRIVEMIISSREQEEDTDEESLGEMIHYFNNLLARPLNINNAKPSSLEELVILTPFEIVAITTYIRDYGEILSFAELLLIPGVSSEKMEILKPFICLFSAGFKISDNFPGRSKIIIRGAVVPQTKEGYKPITRENYMLNPDSRYLGNPLHLYGQYRYTLSNNISALVTLEKDAGERGCDFISWSATAKSIGIVEKLVVGSYTARYGQGMVMWNAFIPEYSWEPVANMKREQGVSPHASADENSAYKGIAATLTKGSLSFSIMASSRRVDARLTESGYTSLLKTGLHNTPLTIERKGSLGVSMAAFNLALSLRRVKVGVTVSSDFKSHPYTGRDSALLLREIQGTKLLSNAGADWRYIKGRSLFYGEIAIDRCSAKGGVAGLIINMKSGMELSLRARLTEKHYRAPHSNVSGVSGSGVWSLGTGVKHKPLNNMTIFFKGELAERYFKLSLMCDYTVEKLINITLRGALKGTKREARADIKIFRGENFTMHTRADISIVKNESRDTYGFYVHNELILKLFNKKVDMSLRGAWFNAQHWENRIYSYEREVLYQFRTTALYGKGLRYYTNLKVSIGERTNLWLRYSSTRYLDRDITGEGPEKIQGPSKGEIKLQLQYSF
ncbi:MAG: hypothetical protein Q8S04_10560 [Bacteroidales bacterium]|nr:hypothetical protein [Bacteroidales bacterium]